MVLELEPRVLWKLGRCYTAGPFLIFLAPHGWVAMAAVVIQPHTVISRSHCHWDSSSVVVTQAQSNSGLMEVTCYFFLRMLGLSWAVQMSMVVPGYWLVYQSWGCHPPPHRYEDSALSTRSVFLPLGKRWQGAGRLAGHCLQQHKPDFTSHPALTKSNCRGGWETWLNLEGHMPR